MNSGTCSGFSNQSFKRDFGDDFIDARFLCLESGGGTTRAEATVSVAKSDLIVVLYVSFFVLHASKIHLNA